MKMNSMKLFCLIVIYVLTAGSCVGQKGNLLSHNSYQQMSVRIGGDNGKDCPPSTDVNTRFTVVFEKGFKDSVSVFRGSVSILDTILKTNRSLGLVLKHLDLTQAINTDSIQIYFHQRGNFATIKFSTKHRYVYVNKINDNLLDLDYSNCGRDYY
jgi:hypothetical protein